MIKAGPYTVDFVSDGSYRLDGGSMFGVVPRALWQEVHPPDQQNRVEVALRCLLVRGEGRTIVIDNGIGDGWSAKQQEILGITRPMGDIVEDLARLGVAPGDVTDMVLTHLHFDHAGSTLQLDAAPKLTFPNATHWLQQANLTWGQDPTERDRVSYRSDKWEAMFDQAPRVELLDGAGEFLPGIRAMIINGHTPGQQLILVGDGSGAVLYCGDLVPYASHLRYAWIMAFDLNPLITLSEKKDILARAATEGWVLAFEHDPQIAACTIEVSDGGFAVKEIIEAAR